MFIGLAIVLVIAWVFGFVVFKVAGFAIHLLIIFAVISGIAHLMGARKKGA